MLRNFGILGEEPTPTVELYFKQCSISVTCRDLGIMAATLANRGVNPVTGKQALQGEYAESVLSVMGSCGMYDYAGEWIYRIGMPAKSGVAGGVIAVLPGHVGIGVFSPRLDARGNSVRGIAVCNELSRYLDLHMFNRPSVGRSGLRLRTSAAELNSTRVRTNRESEVLREFGEAIQIYRLQGNLVFATAEHIVHTVMKHLDRLEYLVLDFKQVLTVNESSCRLFCQLLLTLRSQGKEALFVRAGRHPIVRRYLKKRLGLEFEGAYRGFEDSDLALEWCEDRLLESHSEALLPDCTVEPADYEVFRGFSAAELAHVVPLLKRREFIQGETLMNIGDEAGHLYLLARGRVSVVLPNEDGGQRRLAVIAAGMAFGEMAILDRARRSAMILADTAAACDLLSVEDIAVLRKSHPGIIIKLLENLALALSSKVRKANRELAVLG
jgi:glutaminase